MSAQRGNSTRHPKSRLIAGLAFAALSGGLLTGCQSLAGNANVSQVRIIHASPDAPAVDLYQNNSAMVGDLGFGTITSYVPTAPGTYKFSLKSTATAQTLSTAKATLQPSAQYTVLAGNFAGNLHELILTDQSQPAPSGQISLRFLDEATRASAIDVYLVPSGQKLASVAPLLTGLSYGANRGYLNLPAGTYTIAALPTGTVPTSTTAAAYSGPQITYNSGSARTLVLIDQPSSAGEPGLQLISADDFDSPTS